MSKKSYKIARKTGRGNSNQAPAPLKEGRQRARKATPTAVTISIGPTTRKTIEVPEDYFFRVKMRALKRHMKEKELWSEILGEYFKNHPTE
jgi:hypothetical protein